MSSGESFIYPVATPGTTLLFVMRNQYVADSLALPAPELLCLPGAETCLSPLISVKNMLYSNFTCTPFLRSCC